jgi:hypothetical protein
MEEKSRERVSLWMVGAWLAALAAVVVAALVSHEWGDKGLNPLYPVIFLAILGLAFEGPRKWLGRATNLKLPGGFELTREIEDAVEAVAQLPVFAEEEDDSDPEADAELRVLGPNWWTDPSAALVSLREKLDEQLEWIGDELFAGQHRAGLSGIDRLENERLLKPYELRIARALLRVDGTDLEREVLAGGERGEAACKFVARADKVAYQLRLIVFDTAIRQALGERGMKILDIRDQPRGRWPDFFVFDRKKPLDQPLRVAVRMARTPTSDLIPTTRRRLRRIFPETPLDPAAKPVIVYPQSSKTKPKKDEVVPAMKRQDFLVWVERGMPGGRPLTEADKP